MTVGVCEVDGIGNYRGAGKAPSPAPSCPPSCRPPPFFFIIIIIFAKV